jgi:lysozyme family protein
MQANFAACFNVTIQLEGWHQFSDDRFDPGGATYSGVTQAVYSAWCRKNGRPIQSVRRMTDDDCRAIYRVQYWDHVRGDDLPAGVDAMLFDDAVNSGPVEAVRILQQALSVPIDGMFGLRTFDALLAVKDRAALINQLAALRLSFWRRLRTWWRFGRGWTRRDHIVDVAALKMLGTK